VELALDSRRPSSCMSLDHEGATWICMDALAVKQRLADPSFLHGFMHDGQVS
jgi:hypothetical protein